MPDPASTARRGTLGAIARPSGAFAMVALDQRESLRTMLAQAEDANHQSVPDDALVEFKVEAARALTGHASAVLLDVDYGLGPVRAADAIARGCGLIVAADRLMQRPSGPVERTQVDEAVLSDAALWAIADAFKLLVIWRPDRERAVRDEVVRTFLDGCRAASRPAIVEGIVRLEGADPTADEHADLVAAAAGELGSLGPDLYKAEVPTLGSAADADITRAAERVTAALRCPWVVLSNGTSPERFADATVAACRGGASGFLAGRALWSRSLAAPDRAADLREVAAPRLRDLAERMDSAARPWWDATTIAARGNVTRT
jgi:sulfofructosephosphate aldolase